MCLREISDQALKDFPAIYGSTKFTTNEKFNTLYNKFVHGKKVTGVFALVVNQEEGKGIINQCFAGEFICKDGQQFCSFREQLVSAKIIHAKQMRNCINQKLFDKCKEVLNRKNGRDRILVGEIIEISDSECDEDPGHRRESQSIETPSVASLLERIASTGDGNSPPAMASQNTVNVRSRTLKEEIIELTDSEDSGHRLESQSIVMPSVASRLAGDDDLQSNSSNNAVIGNRFYLGKIIGEGSVSKSVYFLIFFVNDVT